MPDDKQNYTITDAPDRTKEQEEQNELYIPEYMSQLDLSETQEKDVATEFFDELDAINDEWQKEGVLQKMDSLDHQYEGTLQQNEGQQFNLHKHTTKVKVDTAVRYSKKAFLKSDPIFSVSPRPDFQKEGGVEVCEQQQEYLDVKLDEGEIPFKSPLGKTIHSAGVKGIGILKIPHVIKRERAKRTETYQGTPIWGVLVPVPGAGPDDPPQLMRLDNDDFKQLEKDEPALAKEARLIENQGLKDFLAAYPDAPERYQGYVKKLAEGHEIRIVVEYDDVTYNDPLPKYVVTQNFRCRLGVDGYEGMKTTKLLCEREIFTWWELKLEEKNKKFFDVDRLMYEYEKGKPKTKAGSKDEKVKRKGYQNQTFAVWEAVLYVKLKSTDDEETKIRVWIEEESRLILGVTLYPYFGVPCYWVPFYVMNKWSGWLQPSIAEYLTDGNIAEDAFLNFILEAMWMRNLITPIVPEGSTAEEQFLENEWTHGMPITANKDEIDFLQKYMQQIDVGGLVTMMQVLTRTQDDVSGVSSLTTGGESQIDPDAPARKTLELMKLSGINIEEYIETLLESFNEVGKIILQITYQMSREGRKYAPKGKNRDFKEISRSAMIARTNIQSQAMAFNFDEMNVKRELLAFYQAFRSDPLIARNPEGLYVIMKAIVKKWSPMFRNLVDEIMPPIEEFQKEQLQISVQAIAIYVKGVLENSKVTGKAPEFDPQQLLSIIQQARQEAVTPPSEEVVKQREKEQKDAAKA